MLLAERFGFDAPRGGAITEVLTGTVVSVKQGGHPRKDARPVCERAHKRNEIKVRRYKRNAFCASANRDSYHRISFRSQRFQSPFVVFFFHENIIRVERRYREDPDFVFCKNTGNLR